MAKREAPRDRMPERFESIEKAAEFWDAHDLGDYWQETEAAEFEVDLRRRRYLIALDPELAEKLAEEARRRGLSAETLVNLWLSEKLRGSVA